MVNKIGAIPEFAGDGGQPAEPEKKEEAKPEEGKPQEEELPPPEKPAEGEPEPGKEPEKPAGEAGGDDASELKTQIQGLETERQRILQDIQYLRGERRKLREQDLEKVETKIVETKDELADLHPEDIKVLDRYFKVRGFVTKEEAVRMNYDSIRNEVLDEFLSKYPEFKPENDPDDLNWKALRREYDLYKTPPNPRDIMNLLERARKAIAISPGEQKPEVAKKQLETASKGGAAGAQRSSPSKTLRPDLRSQLHGFSEEDIGNIEKNLNK